MADNPSGKGKRRMNQGRGASFSHGAVFNPQPSSPSPGAQDREDDDDDDSDSDDGSFVTTAGLEKVMSSNIGKETMQLIAATAAKNAAKIATRQAMKSVQQQLAMVPQEQGTRTQKSGKGSERGPRMRCAILATGAFVKSNKWTRDNGEVVPYSPTTTNCHAKKAVYELMRYVGSVAISEKDVQKAVNDGSTARRSEHVKWAREGTRVALLDLVQETAKSVRKSHEAKLHILEDWTRSRFYNRVLIQVGLLTPHKEAYRPFISAFLRQVVREGLEATVPGFTPRPEVLFGDNTTHDHLCDEIMKPILQAAIMAIRHEPVPDGETCEGFDEIVKTVEWQVNRVLEEKAKSVYEHAQRFFVSTIWETGYQFQFGPGRIASKLLDKNVSEITEQDAVNAFIPYLDDPTNGPGFDNEGNEIDGDGSDRDGSGGDGSGGDGSGGDRGTDRGNVKAGEQRGADEDADLPERTNKEMTDDGGASGSGVSKAD